MCKLAALFRIFESFRIIIDAIFISVIGLFPIGCMTLLAMIIIGQIDQLYTGADFTISMTTVVTDWFELQPMYDISEKSNLYIIIYYFGQFVMPIILLNMVIAVAFERYDSAVSKNQQLRYQARSSINLELYGLLKISLLLKPLSCIDFSQDLENQNQDQSNDVQGIAQSVKTYIHHQNTELQKQLQNISQTVNSVEKRLNKLKDLFKANNAIHLVAIAKDLGLI